MRVLRTLSAKYREVKQLAEFYQVSLSSMLSNALLSPKHYEHLKNEYYKYKENTAVCWDKENPY